MGTGLTRLLKSPRQDRLHVPTATKLVELVHGEGGALARAVAGLHELDLDVGFALGQFADFVWEHVQGDDLGEVRMLVDDEFAELALVGLSVG